MVGIEPTALYTQNICATITLHSELSKWQDSNLYNQGRNLIFYPIKLHLQYKLKIYISCKGVSGIRTHGIWRQIQRISNPSHSTTLALLPNWNEPRMDLNHYFQGMSLISYQLLHSAIYIYITIWAEKDSNPQLFHYEWKFLPIEITCPHLTITRSGLEPLLSGHEPNKLPVT